jgi:hypothetical protein
MTVATKRRTVLAGLIPALGVRHVRAAERAGEVESSRGECFALAATARRALAPSATVFVGDTVGTGAESALALRLGTATEVHLGQKAQLRIDRFLINAGGVLELEQGGMLFDHDGKAGGSNLAVRSSFGLMAVRGTRFFAGPSNGVFGVFVQRGAVMVVGVNQAVMVASGMGTNIVQPGAEPTAPAPWGVARIDAAIASVM